MIQRRTYSRPSLSQKTRHKPQQLAKKSLKAISKHSQKHKKIPQIIHDLQHNLKLLKKCYEQENGAFPAQSYHSIRPSRSSKKNYLISTKKSKEGRKTAIQGCQQNRMLDDETTQCIELDQLKKSFMNANGYQTNNIVELYNYYRKNYEKSTGIFGSMSCTNHPNSLNNFSDVHESKIRGGSGLGLFEENTHNSHNIREHQHMGLDNSKSTENLENFIKKSSELVNVASLLAQRKKSSRDNLCQKMNQHNLLVQAKRKLIRPSTNQNIERTNHSKLPTEKSLIIQTNTNMVLQKQFQKSSKENSHPNMQNIANKRRSFELYKSQQKQQSSFPEISPFKPYLHKNTDPIILNKQLLVETPKHKIDSSPLILFLQSNRNPHLQKSGQNSHKNRKSTPKLSSPVFPKSIEKYTHSNSKSREKTASKELKKLLSPTEKCDLNKGIIFEEQNYPQKNKSKKSGILADLSLEGCEISMRESGAKNQLEDISFDF